MPQFYDGTKLLSLLDLNGEKPEIFICTSNRNAGKTTWFSRYCVKRFKEYKEKFCLVYRFNYELDEISDKFFKDINTLFFPDDVMTSKPRAKGIYHELFLNDVSCGYAISLNSADQLKKYSHLLSDTKRMLFDEFQSETNHYCSDEVRKLISVHTSIARGQGEQVRYLPLYMVGNPVTLLNPHYVAMGISTRLTSSAKFMRGDGFVLEQGFNESASQMQKASGFSRAFSSQNYIAYSSEGKYLEDNYAFIERPQGKSRYLATLKYQGCDYAIRAYLDLGIIYCDDRVDGTFPFKLAVTTDDHNVNYVMLKSMSEFFDRMRYYFNRGCFRFKDLKCKEAVITSLSY